MKALIFLDDERNFKDVTWVKYPEFDEVIICRQHSEQYIVKASGGVEVIELWWNGLEWDLSFTGAYINQAFLEEALRLLKHLNNGGEL